MEIMRNLSQNLVLTDIYASFNASLVAVIFMADFGGGLNPWAAAVIFATAFAIYALNRQTDGEIDTINNPERTAFLNRNGPYVLAPALVLFAAVAVCTFATNPAAFAAVAAIFMMSAFYSFRLLPRPLGRALGFSRLKEAFFWKNAAVGAMSGMSVFILAPLAGGAPEPALLVLFAFITIRFFIVSTVFDLRDVSGDAKLGIKTIPLAFGKGPTVAFLQGLNAASAAIVLAAFFFSQASRFFLAAAFITALFGAYYIRETQREGADLRSICGYVAEADLMPAALTVLALAAMGLM